MRVEWVHPSWRDLVIEHLANDAATRQRFLSRCSVHGLLLALSVAGGSQGERQLPLLITDADWDALTGRVYLLTPELDVPDLIALMRSIEQALRRPERRVGLEALALAHALLDRLARMWNQARDPLPIPALDAWFALAASLPPDARPPTPLDLTHTWADLFPAAAPQLTDRESVERFTDWLALAGLVLEYQPGDLARLRYYDAIEIIDAFLTSVEWATGIIHPAAHGLVTTALKRIELLVPGCAARCMVLARRLAFESTADEPRDLTPSRERAGWGRFDVARVLQDL